MVKGNGQDEQKLTTARAYLHLSMGTAYQVEKGQIKPAEFDPDLFPIKGISRHQNGAIVLSLEEGAGIPDGEQVKLALLDAQSMVLPIDTLEVILNALAQQKFTNEWVSGADFVQTQKAIDAIWNEGMRLLTQARRSNQGSTKEEA